MTAKTYAACDREIDANAVKVKVGGNTVERCCEDLKEADASTSHDKRGREG
jgi:hypothetical protein